MHQLACVDRIRQLLLNSLDSSDLDDVLDNTQLVELVAQILSFDCSSDEKVYFMKQEAFWILVVMSNGEEEQIRKSFQLDTARA